MKKQIMNRAWEIYRTLVGDRIAKLSMAMRMAWAEVKAPKQTLTGKVRIARCENPDEDSRCQFITFKAWTGKNASRVYISDYKNRHIGYIENGTVTIEDRQGMYEEEISYAVRSFMSKYAA
jgi:3-phenylpropionate/cinnamic acid dioxygenase small subunit